MEKASTIKCNGKPFEKYGVICNKKVRSELELIDDKAWTRYNFRKSVTAENTRTIPLVFQTNNWKSSEPLFISRFIEFSHLFPWIERIHQYVTDNGMEEGIVIKAMFALLQPNSSIIPHIDVTDALLLSHRCHWVIQSDPSVQFMVDEVSSHWPEGHIYELNNKMIHAVYNNSDKPRIHFIVDILPTRYITNGVTYRDFTPEEYKKNEESFETK
jgi:hypothetical protein